MGHNRFEDVVDKLKGVVPLGSLKPLPAPYPPDVMENQPDPAYTPRENPLNALGSKLLGIAKDSSKLIEKTEEGRTVKRDVGEKYSKIGRPRGFN